MSEDPSNQRLNLFLPLMVLIAVFVVGAITLMPVLPAILWGIILSVALAPAHARLTGVLGGRFAASSLIALLLLLVLFLPMLGIFRAFMAFVPDALAWIETTANAPVPAGEGSVDDFIGEFGSSVFPEGSFAARVHADLRLIAIYLGAELKPAFLWLLTELKLFGAFLVEFSLGLVLCTVLVHRSSTIKPMIATLTAKIGGKLATDLVDHALITTRSSVLGLLGSALAQTVLASFSYWLADVPHWAVLSGLTFLLAMIQIGPILIWGPVAAWLALDGQVGMTIFVVIWGTVVVGLTDNVVRSVVVSRSSELPALLALLGALGGLFAWGIVGVFLGPVIIAVCQQLVIRWLAITD